MLRTITTEDALRMMRKMKGGGGASSLLDLGVTATADELNFVKGVTSSIQTQLNDKAASGHNHDSVYSKLGHVHSEYALASHSHSDYAASNHNHDTVYSKLGHVHDYLPLTGGTLTGELIGTNFTASGTLKVSGTSTQGRIDASNIYLTGSLYVGGKKSTTDGKTGVAFGASGNITMQGSSTPTLNFLIGSATSACAKIYPQSDGTYNYLKFVADGKTLVFRKVVESGQTYDSAFYTQTDGGGMLGAPSFKWYRLYAANSSITTSDKRQKKNIKALKNVKRERKNSSGKIEKFDIYGELFDRFEPTEYNLIVGDNRKNFGLIAQDVLEAMVELGISKNELDLVHYDTWIDPVTGETKDAYGIAYENLIPLLIYEVQKLKEGVK